MSASDRLHGVRRWEEWLQGRLSPAGVTRLEPASTPTSDAVWHVAFRDGLGTRLHVAEAALRLSDDEFEALTDRLEGWDWIGAVRSLAPDPVRIHADGAVEEVEDGGYDRKRQRAAFGSGPGLSGCGRGGYLSRPQVVGFPPPGDPPVPATWTIAHLRPPAEVPPMDDREHQAAALRSALLYAVAALAWLVGSDWLIRRFVPASDRTPILEAGKGAAFVVVTAVLLYLWIRRKRRRVEEENVLLAAAVEAAGEAVIITDRDGVIQYVNPAFCRISGYEAPEAVGKTPAILNSGRQDEAFYEELWDTIEAGDTFRGEMVNRRKDGSLYDQECTITPVRGGSGEVTHFVAVARDVTVQHELNRQYRQAQKMEAVGQLASGIAHDFRNVLNVIQANAELLAANRPGRGGADATLSADDVGRLEDILVSARRGTQVVQKLLTLGRENALQLEPLAPGRAFQEMESTLRAALPETIGVRIEAPDGLPAIRADVGALHQVLLNLATNARDAMPGGGTLTIRLAEVRCRRTEGVEDEEEGAPRPGTFVRVTAADTGTGMGEATLKRVFDPFFTTKAEGEGTGLGLPMVRSLVQQHAGFVRVRSIPGRGTRVLLYFPVSTSELPPEAAPDGRAAAAGLLRGTERILLVEDEDALRRVGVQALRRLGYDVRAAADGEEALEVLQSDEPGFDLVVTDLVMPGLGGEGLFERCRERGLAVPFLFTSGYSPDETGRPTNPDRARAFLEKPWTVEQLSRSVRDVLGSAA